MRVAKSTAGMPRMTHERSLSIPASSATVYPPSDKPCTPMRSPASRLADPMQEPSDVPNRLRDGMDVVHQILIRETDADR